LGTNSPRISEKYVITMTTTAKPAASAIGAINGIWLNTLASFSPMVAPPIAPIKIPTREIPTCTVERNRAGRPAISSTRPALRSPFAARAASLLGAIRSEVHSRFADPARRKVVFERIVESGILDWITDYDDAGAMEKIYSIIQGLE